MICVFQPIERRAIRKSVTYSGISNGERAPLSGGHPSRDKSQLNAQNRRLNAFTSVLSLCPIAALSPNTNIITPQRRRLIAVGNTLRLCATFLYCNAAVANLLHLTDH